MEQTFVRVTAEFDTEGNLYPRSLVWEDGCTYEIDRILDLRTAASQKHGGQGDRYTVRIRGQIRYLFFERGPGCGAVGRWFVEKP